MTKLKIVRAPAAVLTTPCLDVLEINSKIVKLAQSMEFALRAVAGMALAANQVGYSKRMFVYLDGARCQVAINPILKGMEGMQMGDESCLSIPGKTFQAKRPTTVRVSYYDLDGNEHQREATDVLARCFMHELDHLSGILLPQYAHWASPPS